MALHYGRNSIKDNVDANYVFHTPPICLMYYRIGEGITKTPDFTFLDVKSGVYCGAYGTRTRDPMRDRQLLSLSIAVAKVQLFFEPAILFPVFFSFFFNFIRKEAFKRQKAGHFSDKCPAFQHILSN